MRQHEYRQRDLAAGVWVKLREELALTEQAFRLDASTAAALERAGRRPIDAGLRLSPPLVGYVVTRAELASVPHEDEIPVRMDDLLRAGHVVLVRFAPAAGER